MARYRHYVQQAQLASSLDLPSEDVDFALDYLSHYYLNKEGVTSENLPKALTQFQQEAGLNVDGALDGNSVRVMSYPRCAVPSYVGQSGKWGLKEITYFVEAYPSILPKNDFDDIMTIVMNDWMAVVDLKLTRVMSAAKANVLIGVGRGKRDGFDGPGSTLAWAYLPPNNNYKGQLNLKFDDDETWVRDLSRTQRGILTQNVGEHEWGHILGLDHSNRNTALMAPIYNPAIATPQQVDDIPRSVALYGAAKVAPPTTPTTPTTPGAGIKLEIAVASLSDVKVNGVALAPKLGG